MQRRIEATTHRGDGTGALQRGNSLSLCFAEPAGLSLELDRIAAALMDGDDVWHAGARAQSFENGGLNPVALPAVRDVESVDAGSAAPVQMVEQGALYVGLSDR